MPDGTPSGVSPRSRRPDETSILYETRIDFRTDQGISDVVSQGSTVFTLIGFAGLYFVLGLLYLYLIGRELAHGPEVVDG